MLKRKLTLKEASPMRCSECLFFKYQRKPGHNCPCSKTGVKAYATAPACFFPDISQLTGTVESFGALMSVFSAYSPKQRRILLALLKTSSKTKKKEHKFGTKVYIPIRNDGKYLSDWVAAYVLGYTSDGKVVISGSPERRSIGRSFTAYLYPDSVFSAIDFAKKKKAMIAEGLINNPKIEKVKRIATVDDYEPQVPTLDTAPRSWFTKKDDVDSSVKKNMSKVTRDSYDRIVRVLTM